MYASERARVVYAGGVIVLFTRFDRFPWTEHWFLRGHLPPKSSRDSRTAVYGRNNNRNRVIYLIIDVIIARWKKRKKKCKKKRGQICTCTIHNGDHLSINHRNAIYRGTNMDGWIQYWMVGNNRSIILDSHHFPIIWNTVLLRSTLLLAVYHLLS